MDESRKEEIIATLIDQGMYGPEYPEVTIFIQNGFRMSGAIEEVKLTHLVLKESNTGKKKVVFYSAISTIE